MYLCKEEFPCMCEAQRQKHQLQHRHEQEASAQRSLWFHHRHHRCESDPGHRERARLRESDEPGLRHRRAHGYHRCEPGRRNRRIDHGLIQEGQRMTGVWLRRLSFNHPARPLVFTLKVCSLSFISVLSLNFII